MVLLLPLTVAFLFSVSNSCFFPFFFFPASAKHQPQLRSSPSALLSFSQLRRTDSSIPYVSDRRGVQAGMMREAESVQISNRRRAAGWSSRCDCGNPVKASVDRAVQEMPDSHATAQAIERLLSFPPRLAQNKLRCIDSASNSALRFVGWLDHSCVCFLFFFFPSLPLISIRGMWMNIPVRGLISSPEPLSGTRRNLGGAVWKCIGCTRMHCDQPFLRL
ncbi:hypothetical protein J3F83DRAFT_737868 [Trichoderma novae-zelandiae]